jgi:hypothetical protein
MPCINCAGMENEIDDGSLDEVLCLNCGQHYYKSTSHSGPWRVYITGHECIDCRWGLPNTDGSEKFTHICGYCRNVYEWGRVTGWELSE